MITKLGIVAGEVWHKLEKQGKIGLEDMIKSIDCPRDVVLMSVGWLAREGHVLLEGDAPNHVLSLRKKEKK